MSKRHTFLAWSRRTLIVVVASLCLVGVPGLPAAAAPPAGGGGGGGGSNGVATPKLTAVVSLSRHRVLATYDRDLDAAALLASSYAFYSTQAVNLPVTGVSRATNNQAFVTTGPQEPVTYTVKLPKTSKAVTFTGSTKTEPKVVSATPVSKTQILVTFSMPMGPGAFLPSSYQINVQGSTTNLAVLEAAQFGPTKTQVMLTTAPQEPVTYILIVGDILSEIGTYMEPGSTTTQVTGSTILPGPMLLGGSSDGDTRVVLNFDAPLDPVSVANLSNYVAIPNLSILNATLQGDNRQIVLVTGPQFQVLYSLVTTVTGLDGNPVNPGYDTISFTGNRPIDNSRPKVTSAASTGNKSVIVQFSKPMADSTADPSRFAIVQTVTHPEVGALTVTAAEFVGLDRLSVKLTTLSQAEVTYQVTANNVTDLMGNPLADKVAVPGGFVDPATYTFPGTPPSYLPCPREGAPDPCVVIDERQNSDGDTLYDHEETRGWMVTIALANGEAQVRQITSSPFSADTDNDGLLDDMERSLNIDPRDRDTDDDSSSDYAEFNETYSDPTKQDTDGDSIFDGYEVTSFRTSPIQSDTDGDQRNDAEEININRNPRVADLPRSALDIGEIGLALDVRFEDTTTTGETTSHSKTATATLTQSQGREYSTTDSRTIEAATNLSQTAGISVEIPTSPGGALFGGTAATVSYEATHEQSSSLSFTSSFTDTSSETSEQKYEESLTSAEELSTGTSRTRSVEGGSIKVTAMLRSVGDIAFTMSNVQLSALVQDPADPSRLTPVATLEPESPPANGYSLGPLSPERGPVIFSSKADQVFPLQVEDLMRNPRSVVVRFANYDITDEKGRNFAFTSQDTYDRTGGLVIDYGSFDSDADGRGDATENHRVATGIGRFVADTNGDGVLSAEEGRGPKAASSDPRARWAAFDVNGNQIGLTLRETLQAAGLVEYNETANPTSTLSLAERNRSYSVIQVPGFGERVHRIRNAQRGPGKEWQIWTPTGLDRSLGLDDIMVLPGNTFRFTYVEDVDDDGLPGVLEWANGCKESSKDSDGDNLDDRFETTVGWSVALGTWAAVPSPFKVYSSCHSTDSDADHVGDIEEAPGVLTRDGRGLVASGDAMGPGSVSTNGTATLAGTSTTFSSSFEVGDSITVAGETRTVSAIASNTSLTASAPFSGTGSELAYFFIASPPQRSALGTTTTVASEAAMLALPAKRGDFAIRSDLDFDGSGPIQPALFMLTADDPSVQANWVKAPTNDPTAPTDAVKQAMGDPISHPGRQDTDGDGINDGAELTPHEVKLQFPSALDGFCMADPTIKCTPLLITSPEWRDSDGDSALDGLEQLVGGDPTQSDRNNFADDDGDGLVNIQETVGWPVVVEEVSLNPTFSVPGEWRRNPCESVCPSGSMTDPEMIRSRPDLKDSDSDGLSDREEMELSTNPTAADTDVDGLPDRTEVLGFSLAGFGTVVTDPTDADTDDDRRSDGAEANLSAKFIVRLEGNTPYEVFTSPVNADRDFDMLVDGEEFLMLTDPGKNDTDGDPRSDYVEVVDRRNPLLPDMLVKMTFVRLLVVNDGENDAGDFEFELSGLRPDGTTIPAVHSFPTTRDGIAALPIDGCGDPICRLGDATTAHPVIRIESGQTLFFTDGATLGRTVDIGSVSMTDKVPQSFGVKGHLYEREHDGNAVIDCWYDFPDPFASVQDGLGTVRGSEMKLGTNSMEIHRSGSCNVQSEFEFRLFVSYTAS